MMESTGYSDVCHSFFLEPLIEEVCNINTMFVRDFLESPNNMPELSELTSANKMDSFVKKLIVLIYTSWAGGEIPEEW